MTSNSETSPAPQNEWEKISEETVSRILSETASRKSVAALRISFLRLQLRVVQETFIAMCESEKLQARPDGEGESAKTSTKARPSRQLRTLQNAARKLDRLLDQQSYPLVYDALDAAAENKYLEYNLHLSPFRFQTFLNRFRNDIKTLDALIDYLEEQKLAFEGLYWGEQRLWLVTGERSEELEARRRLYPYLQRSEGIQHSEFDNEGSYHEDPRQYLIREIARLYEYAYGDTFNINQRYEMANFQPASGETRYRGSCIRFACATIEGLQLSDRVLSGSKASGKTDRDRLMNRVGDIWSNLSQ